MFSFEEGISFGIRSIGYNLYVYKVIEKHLKVQ